MLNTTQERARYILARLERLKARHDGPHWTVEELDELKGWLKDYVRNRSNVALGLERLIAWAKQASE